jgi:hypothetical protein
MPLLAVKPIGGQIGDGDGIGVAVFFGFFFFTGFLLGFLVGFLVVEAVGLLADVFDAEGAVDALLLGFGVGVAALVGAVRNEVMITKAVTDLILIPCSI